jgi:phage shock protein PspC (stress-responsive transcriptional regulator)
MAGAGPTEGPGPQTPPGAGFGTPGGPAAGFGAPEAPPIAPTGLPPAGGYATRFGLVRPNQGRFFAGVCAALGRATNTDPVLWRVLLPVLTLLGGLGVLLYILGMILIPAEGDSGSPVEALAGRGQSSTPRGVTIVLSIIAAVSIIVGIAHFGTSLLIAVAVIGGIAFLVTSRSGPANGWQPTWPTMTRTGSGFTVDWPKQNSPAGAHTGTGTGWGPADGVGAPSAGPTDAPATATMAASHTAAPAAEPIDTPGWSPTPEPSTDEGADVLAAAAKYETGWPMTDTSTDEPTYQAPFAPHGPYVPTSPYSSSFPGLAPTAVVTPPPPPQPPKPHSPTRRITLSAALLVVGFLAILDVAGVASVPAPMYFAAALATIGIGMFIASFFGRVRGPITIGVLLVIGLLLSAVVSGLPHPFTSHTTRITPTSFAAIPGGYQDNYGDVRLDLSKVKFTDADHKDIKIRLTFGQISVVLPPDVDVTVIAHAGAGDLDILGQQHSGVNKDSYTITDDGHDGPGGGTLTIDASVRAGEVEVIR